MQSLDADLDDGKYANIHAVMVEHETKPDGNDRFCVGFACRQAAKPQSKNKQKPNVNRTIYLPLVSSVIRGQRFMLVMMQRARQIRRHNLRSSCF